MIALNQWLLKTFPFDGFSTGSAWTEKFQKFQPLHIPLLQPQMLATDVCQLLFPGRPH
jgi:hypothetical protein